MNKIFLFFQTSQPHLSLFPLVGFLGGILMYFSLSFEPSWILLLGLLFCIGLLTFLVRYRQFICMGLLVLSFFIGGLFVCASHTVLINTIFLPYTLQNVTLSGKVETIQPRLNRVQVILTDLKINGLSKNQTPRRALLIISLKNIEYSKVLQSELMKERMIEKAKITLLQKIKRTEKKILKKSSGEALLVQIEHPDLNPGDIISGESFLLKPPMVPAGSGAYYQAREMWFEGIGAVGSLSNVKLLHYGNKSLGLIDSLRQKIRHHIQKSFSVQTNGVIQALVLGDTGQLTMPIRSLYRTLGLSHVLSVSGFHISLIAFLIFTTLRYVFSLLPISGKAIFLKQLAGILALMGTGLYVLVSNAHPPAVRAFVMISFVFLCLFIDRRALSLYSVAVAAFLILCVKPFLLLNAGFQLSFIAVLSLVVLVQEGIPYLNRWLRQNKILVFVMGLILLNVIVTITTTPFVLYHFHQFAVYSILGNLLLSFVFSLAILPLLTLGIFLIPFGLDEFVFSSVQVLLSLVHWIGEQIVLLPNSIIYFPSFPAWGLVCFAFGLIWLCLLYGPVRLIGFLFIGLFFFSFMIQQQPDVIIGQGGRVFAVRDENGKLHLSESFRHHFLTDQWLSMNGQNPVHYWEPRRFYPDFVNIRGQKIAFSADSCSDALITVAIKKGDYSRCPAPIYTREKLDKITPLAFYVTSEKIRIVSGMDQDKKRPWGLENRSNYRK